MAPVWAQTPARRDPRRFRPSVPRPRCGSPTSTTPPFPIRPPASWTRCLPPARRCARTTWASSCDTWATIASRSAMLSRPGRPSRRAPGHPGVRLRRRTRRALARLAVLLQRHLAASRRSFASLLDEARPHLLTPEPGDRPTGRGPGRLAAAAAGALEALVRNDPYQYFPAWLAVRGHQPLAVGAGVPR